MKKNYILFIFFLGIVAIFYAFSHKITAMEDPLETDSSKSSNQRAGCWGSLVRCFCPSKVQYRKLSMDELNENLIMTPLHTTKAEGALSDSTVDYTEHVLKMPPSPKKKPWRFWPF